MHHWLWGYLHTSGEGYVREERGELENVNIYKLAAATEPYDLSLRGIEKEAVCGHPRNECVNRPTHLG